jgi:hypothetical protein
MHGHEYLLAELGNDAVYGHCSNFKRSFHGLNLSGKVVYDHFCLNAQILNANPALFQILRLCMSKEFSAFLNGILLKIDCFTGISSQN